MTKAQKLYQADAVCNILIHNKLLAANRAREILRQKDALLENLEKQRQKKYKSTPAAELISNTLTIIDVIASLNLSRLDKPGLPLDEETIYQALAREWQIPYYKLDPLKLDLNVVTNSITRSFAMKHLVLPVEISDGVLTVATPNPFNLEVLDDIASATKMKVQMAVSPKSDIIRSECIL